MQKRLEKRPELRTLVGALILGFGIIASLAFANYFVRDMSIWVLGRRAIAEVVDQWYEVTGENEEGEPLFQYYIRYRFEASNGKTLEHDQQVGAMEWGAMPIGSQVIVDYFPLYPQHNRLDNARYIPFYACTYVPVAFLSVAALMFGWSLVRSGPKEPLPELVGRNFQE
jgi:hypothetical protein